MAIVGIPSGGAARQQMVASSLRTQRRPHELFAAGRRFAHVPRMAYLNQLNEHCASAGKPLIIYAPSGAGKSSLIAYWAEEWRKRRPSDFIVEHYIGCGAGGEDAIDLIGHVAAEVREYYSIEHELPTEPGVLMNDFPVWLWHAGHCAEEHSASVILLIDALERLPEKDHRLEWLPATIPSGVRLVTTTADEKILAHLKERSWEVLTLPPFTLEERRSVVRTFMSRRGAALTSTQQQAIADDAGSANPLLLRTRLEETRAATDNELRNVIDYYLGAKTLDELYQRLLARLEEEFGEARVAELFGLLYTAHNGLEHAELHELCGSSAILPQLLHRLDFHLSVREETLRFHHDALRTAVLGKYLGSEDLLYEYRNRITRQFSTGQPTKRSATEVAFQLSELREWRKLAGYITDVSILTTLYDNETRYTYLKYWQCLKGHLDIAEQYHSSILAYKASHKPAINVARTLKTGGDLAQITGNWNVATELYEGMRDIAETLQNDELLADATNNIGTMQWKLGNIADAETYYTTAKEIAERSGNRLLSATIQGNLGILHFVKGDFALAVECHKENLAVVRDLGDSYGICRVLGNLGGAYLRLKEYEIAARLFRKMYTIARKNNDAARIAAAVGNLGHVFYGQRLYGKALGCFKKLYAIAQEVGIPQQRATAVGEIGSIYFMMKRYDIALKAYRAQHRMARLLGDNRLLAASACNIGLALEESSVYAAAAPWYKRALTLYRLSGNQKGMVTMYGTLSGIALQQNNYIRAQTLNDMQISIAKQMNDSGLLDQAFARQKQIGDALAHHILASGKPQSNSHA